MDEFFKSLRQAAAVLDKDISGLKEAMDKPPRQRQVEGSPILILRQMQQQGQALKKEVKEGYEEVKQQGEGFVELVAACQALLDKQTQSLQAVEDHLVQYGYQPQAPTEQEKLVGISTDQLNNIEGDHLAQSSPKTPDKTNDNVFVKPKTPKLEDFGLSWERLNANAEIHQRKLHGMDTTDTGRSLLSANIAMGTNGSTSRDYPRSPTIPKSMDTGGISVTPRLFGGTLPNRTPAEFVEGSQARPAWSPSRSPVREDSMFASDASPALWGSSGTRPQTLDLLEQARNVRLAAQNLNKKEPPTPEFPDLKTRIQHSLAESRNKFGPKSPASSQQPLSPMYSRPPMSPGLAARLGARDPGMPPRLGSLSQAPDTPEMPQLTTVVPSGGMGSSTGYVPREVVKPRLTSLDDHPSTPEVPELTTTVPMRSASTSNGAISNGVGGGGPHMEVPSPEYPTLQTPGLSRHQAFNPRADPTRPHLQSLDDVPSTPEMPELTSRITIPARAADVSTSLNEPILASSHGVVSTPEPPQLTSNFSQRHLEKESHHNGGAEMDGEISGKLMPTLEENEYYALPDYLRKQLSLDMMNETIHKVNHLLLIRREGGGEEQVTESDLRSELGPKTRSVLLSLVKLQRLVPTGRIGGQAYCLP